MPDIPFKPEVAIGLGVSALIALGAPLAMAFVFRRRTGASLKYFAIGAVVFFVSQIVLRLPWQIPLAKFVQANTTADSALTYAFIAFSALTAGLFEETGRWCGYRFLIKEERSWRVAVMYGLGHGGIESILLIGINMAVLWVLYVALARGIQLPLPKDKLDAIARVVSGLTPGQTLAGGIERLFALCLQVGFSVVVLQVFVRSQLRWLAYAMAMHFVVDFCAVVALKRGGALFAEALVGAFAVASLVLIARMRRSEQLTPKPGAAPTAATMPH